MAAGWSRRIASGSVSVSKQNPREPHWAARETKSQWLIGWTQRVWDFLRSTSYLEGIGSKKELRRLCNIRVLHGFALGALCVLEWLKLLFTLLSLYHYLDPKQHKIFWLRRIETWPHWYYEDYCSILLGVGRFLRFIVLQWKHRSIGVLWLNWQRTLINPKTPSFEQLLLSCFLGAKNSFVNGFVGPSQKNTRAAVALVQSTSSQAATLSQHGSTQLILQLCKSCQTLLPLVSRLTPLKLPIREWLWSKTHQQLAARPPPKSASSPRLRHVSTLHWEDIIHIYSQLRAKNGHEATTSNGRQGPLATRRKFPTAFLLQGLWIQEKNVFLTSFKRSIGKIGQAFFWCGLQNSLRSALSCTLSCGPNQWLIFHVAHVWKGHKSPTSVDLLAKPTIPSFKVAWTHENNPPPPKEKHHQTVSTNDRIDSPTASKHVKLNILY